MQSLCDIIYIRNQGIIVNVMSPETDRRQTHGKLQIRNGPHNVCFY